MKIDIPVICADVALSEYDERLSPAVIKVWVNPTRQFLRERDEMIAGISSMKTAENPVTEEVLEPFNNAMMDWYARLWSKGADPETHWTADEVRVLNETDPSLFHWLLTRSGQVMREHRENEKKNFVTP